MLQAIAIAATLSASLALPGTTNLVTIQSFGGGDCSNANARYNHNRITIALVVGTWTISSGGNCAVSSTMDTWMHNQESTLPDPSKTCGYGSNQGGDETLFVARFFTATLARAWNMNGCTIFMSARMKENAANNNLNRVPTTLWNRAIVDGVETNIQTLIAFGNNGVAAAELSTSLRTKILLNTVALPNYTAPEVSRIVLEAGVQVASGGGTNPGTFWDNFNLQSSTAACPGNETTTTVCNPTMVIVCPTGQDPVFTAQHEPDLSYGGNGVECPNFDDGIDASKKLRKKRGRGR